MKNLYLSDYDEWIAYRNDFFNAYPVDPNHMRMDIEIAFPSATLKEVPVSFNPHGGGLDSHYLHYECDLWYPVSDICKISDGSHPPCYKMIVESQSPDRKAPRFSFHSKPDGRLEYRPLNPVNNIKLMSTASCVYHEWWAARNNWNDFAFLADKFWKITWSEVFSGWPADMWIKSGRLGKKDAPWGYCHGPIIKEQKPNPNANNWGILNVPGSRIGDKIAKLQATWGTLDFDSTEEVTIVGNNKVWNSPTRWPDPKEPAPSDIFDEWDLDDLDYQAWDN